MKKFILALTALLVMTVSASAMSYEQARQQALFLTDKMAYELNLTDAQYEAAYEINLDYLMGVRTVDDLYGTYWERRRLDFSYILLSWQYRAFCDAAYFFRPLYWDAGYWHFGIYARYPHRDYFFFGRPTFYVEYRGGHAWHMNGGRSWYRSRHYRPAVRHDNRYHGMRDGFSRGDFGNGYRGNPNSATSFGAARRPPVMGGSSFGNGKGKNNGNGNSFGNGNSNGNSFGSGKRPAIGGARTSNGNSFGNANRESSTRSTETKGGSSFGGHRSGSVTSVPRNTFSPSTSTGGSSSNESTGSSFGRRPSSSSNSTFGGSRRSSSFGSNSGSSSFGNSSGSSSFGNSSGSSSFGGSRRSSSFGSNSGSSSFGNSSGSSFGSSRRSSSSFGGSKSSGSSFGGSRSSGSSFGSSRSGGSSFGSSRSGGNSNRGGGSSFGGHR